MAGPCGLAGQNLFDVTDEHTLEAYSAQFVPRKMWQFD